MVGVRTPSAVWLGAALLAACTAGAPERAGTDQGDPAKVASLRDLTGAACRSANRFDIAPDPAAPMPVYLYCGTKTRASGAVSATPLPLTMPKDDAGRRALLQSVAAASPAGRDAATRMSCRDGSWTQGPDGSELLIRPCALSDGGWPQIETVAAMGKYVVQGEGLPAMFPVLAAAMQNLAGTAPDAGAPAMEPEAARRLLQMALGGELHLIGGRDFERFGELTETARLNNSRKNFRAAEDAYREALNIQERAFAPGAVGIGLTLTNLALEVSNQGRFEEAAALFRRADPIIQRSPDAGDRARFFTYMAFDAANSGRFQDALRYAREATSIWREMAEKDTPGFDTAGGADEAKSAARGELAHSLNIEAAMALRVGELADAEAAAKEALVIVGEEPGLPPWWRPEVLTTMGEIYARQDKLSDAEQSFRGALIFQQRLFGDTAPTAATLLALGRVYAGEGLNGESVRAYEFALNILARDEVARSQVVFDQIAPLITAANALAREQPAQRKSLDAMIVRALQLMTTGVTDQTISRASARLAAKDPAIERLVRDLQDSERRRDAARIELAHQTSLPDEQRGALKEANLLTEINQNNARRDAVLAELQKDFPSYASLANPGPVPLADLQAHLKPREALVRFELGRERAFAIVVRSDRFQARPLELDQAKLDAAVRGLRRAFAVRSGGIDDFDLADAYDLYRALFAPIENELAGVDHLIVSPSGALASLPVALLVTERPAGQDYRRAAWLVRRFAISEVPSLRAFVTLRDSASLARAPKPFFGVGNPMFEGAGPGAAPARPGQRPAANALDTLAGQCRDAGPIPPQMLRALAPLPETAGELGAVSRILGAGSDSLLLGAAANEANLRHHTLSDYRVLYFATHGLLPGELSCQSEPALALSPPASAATSKDEDGLLDASEIAGLQLNADLVVLSACNTAQGGAKLGGEALSGLAEAFFYAGARTLIASHWQVPSTATVGLMTGMFQRLGPNLSGGTAEAMRQSQLALIAQPATAHPFFWAAFTVIGDGAATAAAERSAAR